MDRQIVDEEKEAVRKMRMRENRSERQEAVPAFYRAALVHWPKASRHQRCPSASPNDRSGRGDDFAETACQSDAHEILRMARVVAEVAKCVYGAGSHVPCLLREPGNEIASFVWSELPRAARSLPRLRSCTVSLMRSSGPTIHRLTPRLSKRKSATKPRWPRGKERAAIVSHTTAEEP